MNKRNIYNILLKEIGNPYAVCGIMGNLMAESALHANNLQNSGNKKLNMTDEEYTKAVDDCSYSNFIHDSHGYGLAQWTFWSRKDMLLQFARNRGDSIGNETMQCEFLLYELKKNYSSLWASLKECDNIKDASDKFCTMYERPADQSANALAKRSTYAKEIYDEMCVELTESAFLKELDALLNKYGYTKRGT